MERNTAGPLLNREHCVKTHNDSQQWTRRCCTLPTSVIISGRSRTRVKINLPESGRSRICVCRHRSPAARLNDFCVFSRRWCGGWQSGHRKGSRVWLISSPFVEITLICDDGASRGGIWLEPNALQGFVCRRLPRLSPLGKDPEVPQQLAPALHEALAAN